MESTLPSQSAPSPTFATRLGAFAALFVLDVKEIVLRPRFVLSALVLLLLPLAAGVVDQRRAWVAQSIANALTIFVFPMMACVLVTTLAAGGRVLLTRPLSRLSAILARFFAVSFVCLVLALLTHALTYCARIAFDDAELWHFATPLEASGDYARSKEGQAIWLFREHQHHVDLTYALDADANELDGGRELRLDFVIGPGNLARQAGEEAYLDLAYRWEGEDWQRVQELNTSGLSVRTLIPKAPSGQERLQLRVTPGRSDFALGLRQDAVRIAAFPEASLWSGWKIALLAFVGSLMLMAASLFLAARLSRPTAFVFALTLLVIGLLKGSIGLGAKMALSDALSDRVVDVVQHDASYEPSAQLSFLAWYPDLSFGELRGRFESGEAIDLEALPEGLDWALLLMGGFLVGAWLLVRSRDEHPSEL